LLELHSAALSKPRAAIAMLRGGLAPDDVAAAVRRTGARAVSAHNVLPSLGWRALAAARETSARVVLHLHNYRLVCAVGTCVDPDESDCVRCHGRNTAPGVLRNCRGSRAEALVYGVALSAWQRRLVDNVDRFVVPSAFAAARLRRLGAPISEPVVVPHAIADVRERSRADAGRHVLIAGRLARDKGVDIALAACAAAGLYAVVAGDGPLAGELRATYPQARFVGHVGAPELAKLRDEAGLAIVASRAAETFGLAAAEALAAGVPVVASRIGALEELLPSGWLAASGDVAGLAEAARRLFGDRAAGELALRTARERLSPEIAAAALAEAYA
jgi:glycosyltransferase involved in cell wall biosynthesis